MNELYKKAIICAEKLSQGRPGKIQLTMAEWEELEDLIKSPKNLPSPWTLRAIASLLWQADLGHHPMSSSILTLLQFVQNSEDKQVTRFAPFILSASKTHILMFHQRQGTRIPFAFIKQLGTILTSKPWDQALMAMEILDSIGSQALLISDTIIACTKLFTFPWQRDKRSLRQLAKNWKNRWKNTNNCK